MKKVTYMVADYMFESCCRRLMAQPTMFSIASDTRFPSEFNRRVEWTVEDSTPSLPESWAKLVWSLPVEDEWSAGKSLLDEMTDDDNVPEPDDNNDTGLSKDEALAWFENDDWQRLDEWVAAVRKVITSEVTCLAVNVYGDVRAEDAETLRGVLVLIFPSICVLVYREI